MTTAKEAIEAIKGLSRHDAIAGLLYADQDILMLWEKAHHLASQIDTFLTEVEKLKDGQTEEEDVIAWADGIQGALGTEYSNAVSQREAAISYAILNVVAQRKKAGQDQG